MRNHVFGHNTRHRKGQSPRVLGKPRGLAELGRPTRVTGGGQRDSWASQPSICPHLESRRACQQESGGQAKPEPGQRKKKGRKKLCLGGGEQGLRRDFSASVGCQHNGPPLLGFSQAALWVSQHRLTLRLVNFPFQRQARCCARCEVTQSGIVTHNHHHNQLRCSRKYQE